MTLLYYPSAFLPLNFIPGLRYHVCIPCLKLYIPWMLNVYLIIMWRGLKWPIIFHIGSEYEHVLCLYMIKKSEQNLFYLLLETWVNLHVFCSTLLILLTCTIAHIFLQQSIKVVRPTYQCIYYRKLWTDSYMYMPRSQEVHWTYM